MEKYEVLKYNVLRNRDFFEKTSNTLASLGNEDYETRRLIDYFLQLYHNGKICRLGNTAEHKPFKITGNESIIKNSPLPYEVSGNYIDVPGIHINISPILIDNRSIDTRLFKDSLVRINFKADFYEEAGFISEHYFNIDYILAQNALKFIDFFLLNVARIDEEFKKQDSRLNKLVEIRNKQIKLISSRVKNDLFSDCIARPRDYYNNPKFLEWEKRVKKTDSIEYQIYKKANNNIWGLDLFGGEPQIEGTLYLEINDDITLEHYIYAENPEKLEEKLLELRKLVDDIRVLVSDTSKKSGKTAA